ncbi:hypothetical protein ACHAPK_011595 [Fusarium culmorum]
MNKVAKLHLKADQKKASDCRQEERRRMWEKRATNPEQRRLDEEFDAKVKAEREQMTKERPARAEAEKAAKGEKKVEEADDEALGKKVEKISLSSNNKDEVVLVDEDHKDLAQEEKMPDPWNAICIVGVRVYSKDEHLSLWTAVEGVSSSKRARSPTAGLTSTMVNPMQAGYAFQISVLLSPSCDKNTSISKDRAKFGYSIDVEQ